MNNFNHNQNNENITHQWSSSNMAINDNELNCSQEYSAQLPFINKPSTTMIESLRQSRHAFIHQQSLANHHIRPDILNSWRRCFAHGVASSISAYEHTQCANINQLLAQHAVLIRATQSVFNTMLSYTLPANSHLILADKHGVVLYTAGRDLTPIGSVLTEAEIGTNGIGTCLVEHRPIYVMGPEHYVEQFQQSHCSAAPIFVGQQLVAVMSLAVPLNQAHLHSLGMLAAAAITIAQQVKLAQTLQEQQTLLEVLNEGIIILDNQQHIHSINQYARRLFNAQPQVIGQPLSMLLTDAPTLLSQLNTQQPCQDIETACRRRDGQRLSLTCSVSYSEQGHSIISVREQRRTQALTRRLLGAQASYRFEDIVGRSAAIESTFFQAKQASQSDATALIWGESGTGKELIAQSIHNASHRANGPFIVVNCGAIPRELIQSELFGYEAGAYTGAQRGGAAGKFELADGGTIFLDEIGEMPLAAQVSLLRFLQEKEVIRVGGQNRQLVDVRVIAATNKNLSQAVQQRQFRADLFYRINVLALHVPPLREREGDIELLAKAFIAHNATALKQAPKALAPEALQRLNHYPWPGNVRELENVIERAMNLSRYAVLQAEDIHLDNTLISPNISSVTANNPPQRLMPTEPHNAGGQLHANERDTIIAALTHTNGNLRLAAQQLGISRSGLYNKINRYQLVVADFRASRC